MKKRISNNKINIELTLLCLPTIIWYIAFCYLPVFGIVLAFKRYQLVPGRNFFYSLFFGSKWVGLSNFRFLLGMTGLFIACGIIFEAVAWYQIPTQAKSRGTFLSEGAPRAIPFLLGFAFCLLVLQQDLGGVAVVDHRDHQVLQVRSEEHTSELQSR